MCITKPRSTLKSFHKNEVAYAMLTMEYTNIYVWFDMFVLKAISIHGAWAFLWEYRTEGCRWMNRFFFVHQLSDSILFSAIMSSRCLLPTSNVDTNWRFTFERNLLISIFTVSSFFRAKIYFSKYINVKCLLAYWYRVSQ